MTMEGMGLIPLESNLHKYHPVIISQIINMIELDNFWHCKMFESVMSSLWNMRTEGIRNLENVHMHCTNNDENNNEMDGVEVIDLCSVSQSKNGTFSERKESANQESQDKSSQIKDKEKRIHNQKGKSRICNDVLGAYKRFLTRRASRRTREGGEETCQKDGKAKTWRRTCRTYTRYKQLTNKSQSKNLVGREKTTDPHWRRKNPNSNK